MDWKKDAIDEKYFLDSGLLFHINRTTLHLLGLALTVRKDDKGNVTFAVKDMRSNPEQATFSAEILENGQKKIDNYMREFGDSQITIREEKLGWGCQPHVKRQFHQP